MNARQELLQCPYNREHFVKAGRIQQHIVKCQARYASEEFRMCPFNTLHRHRPEEHLKHIATCPERVVLEKSLYSNTHQNEGGDLRVPVFNNKPVPCDETWEEDCHNTYQLSNSDEDNDKRHTTLCVISNEVKQTTRDVLNCNTNGLPLTNLLGAYQDLAKHSLNFVAFGFSTLISFMQAMPDIVRLDWSKTDKTYYVYPVIGKNSTCKIKEMMAKCSTGSSWLDDKTNNPDTDQLRPVSGSHLTQISSNVKLKTVVTCDKSCTYSLPTTELNETRTPMISDKMKNNMRRLVVANPNGVLLNELNETYDKMYKQLFDFTSLGFQCIFEFFTALPDIIKLEWSQPDQTYRIHAVKDVNTNLQSGMEISSEAKDTPFASAAKILQWQDELTPNLNGHYAIALNLEPGSKQELPDDLRSVANIVQVNFTRNNGAFIRYKSQEDALATMVNFSKKYALYIPRERSANKKILTWAFVCNTRDIKMEAISHFIANLRNGPKGKMSLAEPCCCQYVTNLCHIERYLLNMKEMFSGLQLIMIVIPRNKREIFQAEVMRLGGIHKLPIYIVKEKFITRMSPNDKTAIQLSINIKARHQNAVNMTSQEY